MASRVLITFVAVALMGCNPSPIRRAPASTSKSVSPLTTTCVRNALFERHPQLSYLTEGFDISPTRKKDLEATIHGIDRMLPFLDPPPSVTFLMPKTGSPLNIYALTPEMMAGVPAELPANAREGYGILISDSIQEGAFKKPTRRGLVAHEYGHLLTENHLRSKPQAYQKMLENAEARARVLGGQDPEIPKLERTLDALRSYRLTYDELWADLVAAAFTRDAKVIRNALHVQPNQSKKLDPAFAKTLMQHSVLRDFARKSPVLSQTETQIAYFRLNLARQHIWQEYLARASRNSSRTDAMRRIFDAIHFELNSNVEDYIKTGLDSQVMNRRLIDRVDQAFRGEPFTP